MLNQCPMSAGLALFVSMVWCPYGSRGNEVGGSEVNVLMIEVTSVIKSPCLHLVIVLMVEIGNYVSYSCHLCTLLIWGRKDFFFISTPVHM